MFFDSYMKHFTSPLDLTYNNFMAVARHNEGFVLNFSDGHAKFYRWNGVPPGGETPAAATRPGVPYYSWRFPLVTGITKLESMTPNTQADPYNDMHGVPGTDIGDSEDFGPC
jgi:hypothetical protein